MLERRVRTRGSVRCAGVSLREDKTWQPTGQFLWDEPPQSLGASIWIEEPVANEIDEVLEFLVGE